MTYGISGVALQRLYKTIMCSLTYKKFWDSYYHDFKPHKVEKVIFSDVFKKYLKTNSNQTILEVGCAGGNFLCYLTKRFGFEAHGVDYSDEIWTTNALFEYNNLPKRHYTKKIFLIGIPAGNSM